MKRGASLGTRRDSICPFCNQEDMEHNLPTPKPDGSIPCNRGLYDDEFTYAVLCPEQYTTGHTLVILKDHKADILDNVSSCHLLAFISAIQRVAARLKEAARNSLGQCPERIYVCTMCDGVSHLHAHLIPRYPFNDEDIHAYRTIFTKRDGEEQVYQHITARALGGYWYIAEREKNHKDSEFGRKPSQERARVLEELADRLRDLDWESVCPNSGELFSAK